MATNELLPVGTACVQPHEDPAPLGPVGGAPTLPNRGFAVQVGAAKSSPGPFRFFPRLRSEPLANPEILDGRKFNGACRGGEGKIAGHLRSPKPQTQKLCKTVLLSIILFATRDDFVGRSVDNPERQRGDGFA